MANQPTTTWLPTRVNDMPFTVVQTFRSLQNWLARPKFLNGITVGKNTTLAADERFIDTVWFDSVTGGSGGPTGTAHDADGDYILTTDASDDSVSYLTEHEDTPGHQDAYGSVETYEGTSVESGTGPVSALNLYNQSGGGGISHGVEATAEGKIAWFGLQSNGARITFRFESSDANGPRIGFFNHVDPPAAQQTVTGSRGGNAALASLLTALANYGLIVDSTSALGRRGISVMKEDRPKGSEAQCPICSRIFGSDRGCETHKPYAKPVTAACKCPAGLGLEPRTRRGLTVWVLPYPAARPVAPATPSYAGAVAS